MGGEAATSSLEPSALTETPAPAQRGTWRLTTDVRQTKVKSDEDKVSRDPHPSIGRRYSGNIGFNE